jgi:ATP-binding cassette subfamily B protein
VTKKPSSSSGGEPSGPQSWRERLSALQYVPPMIKLVWDAHHAYTMIIVVLRIIRSVIPVAFLWVGKLIIDAIVAAREGNGDFRRLWKLIALEIGIVVTRDLVSRASDLIESLLSDLFNRHASARLMAHAATLDLYHFEDPTFYDKLERARQQTTNRLNILTRLLTMVQDFLTLFSLGAVLFVYSPLLLLLLIVTVLPSFFGETYFAAIEYMLFHHWTSERRHIDYLRYVGASDTTAKEVQLFDLSPWLISRFQKASKRFYDVSKKLSIRKVTVISIFSLIGTIGYYTAYAIILVRAFNGSIGIGTLTFLAGSFARARDLIYLQLMGVSNVFSQSLFLKNLFDFFDMKASITSPPDAPVVPRPIRDGIVFEDVSFHYPESDMWALRHVSFKLKPGERVAFVGENGAGKTTITKLLARLYDPTEGRILIDGRDIIECDLQSLRRMIGVIFQDFVRYDWRFDENIGIGEINEVRSYLDSVENAKTVNGNFPLKKEKIEESQPEPVPVPPSIIAAAEKSLASTLLPNFSEGYHQMLGRRFNKGIQLSGGEWQKIALARAYMRDAQVLILDEPTAALDARAEYEVFERFSRLVAGRMAVIISHRFSTVRMADRIIVLRNGSILEEGTHNELVVSGGLYTELFDLQAQGYR